MKKILLATSFLLLACVAQVLTVRAAANPPLPPVYGGLGTNQTPASGTIPIGNGAGSYTPSPISVVGALSITDASGSITLTGTGTTTTIQSVLNALSAAGLATYNSSTGVFTVSSSSLNLGTASQYNKSDVLPSSTLYVSSFNTRTGAVTLTSGDVTAALGFTPIASAPATTTINGTQAVVFYIVPGFGITSTVSGATTTFTLNLGTGCSGGNFVQTISPTGTVTCATPSGGASSTNVYGTAGVNVVQVGTNATASLDTAYAASWSNLETFLKGATINGTTTLASTTNALIVTNGSGQVIGYAATVCPANQAFTGLSATGTPFCSTFITSGTATTTIAAGGGTATGNAFTFSTSTKSGTWNVTSSASTVTFTLPSNVGFFANDAGYLTGNQTITLTGAVTGSGATTIATTFTTSTLYGLFSGVSPITFNTSTGAIGFNNPGYITANQSITFTPSGDASGSASGATSLTPNIKIIGLQGKTLPSLATGTLYYNGGAWLLGNAVDASGNPYVTSTSQLSSSTIWGLFSNTATGLTYTNSTGVTSLTSGYFIPLTASATQWNAAYASTSALGSFAFISALPNSGVASGSYPWGTFTVASSGIITSATANPTPVTSFNGSTGAVTGVSSLSNNSASGGIDFSAATGTAITGVLHSLAITQFTGNWVSTFNGATGTVTGVGSLNSETGTITLQGTANQITVASSGQTITASLPSTINATNLNLSGTLGVSSTITQTGGLVSLASTTINGNATTTGLTITGIASGNCLHTTTNGAVVGTGSDCGAGGGGVNINQAGASTTYTMAIQSTTSTAPSITTSSANIAVMIPSRYMMPSWLVAASGGDYTTIQPALDACGAAGGGTIYIASGTYAQAGTGLLWKGSNCAVYGQTGATTITFTGATTGFKTGSSTALYGHNELHNLIITGDNTTSSVAVDMSNMDHNVYDNLIIDSVASAFALHDTQDITFYNIVSNFDATTIKSFGIDGSSSEPWNANTFSNGFIGCGSKNCVGLRMINAEHNTFDNIRWEPAGSPLAGTIGIQIADANVGSNPGTFGNVFINNYIEGNAIAINVSSSVSAGQGVDDNMFIGGISDTNATINAPTSTQTQFIGFNNNFSLYNVLASTTFNGSVVDGNTLSVGGGTTLATTTATKLSVGTTTNPGLATQLVSGQLKYIMPVDATGSTSSTLIDFSIAARQMVALSTSTKITIKNTENGDSDALKVCQDGTGSRTATWATTSANATTTIDWGKAGAPTLTTTAGDCDWFTFLTSPMNSNTASSVVQGFYGQNAFTN